MLSAFFGGYIFGQVPSSRIALKHGARRVLASALVATAFFNFLIPIAARSPLAVCVLRVLIGLAQSGTFPCTVRKGEKGGERGERGGEGGGGRRGRRVIPRRQHAATVSLTTSLQC